MRPDPPLYSSSDRRYRQPLVPRPADPRDARPPAAPRRACACGIGPRALQRSRLRCRRATTARGRRHAPSVCRALSIAHPRAVACAPPSRSAIYSRRARAESLGVLDQSAQSRGSARVASGRSDARATCARTEVREPRMRPHARPAQPPNRSSQCGAAPPRMPLARVAGQRARDARRRALGRPRARRALTCGARRGFDRGGLAQCLCDGVYSGGHVRGACGA